MAWLLLLFLFYLALVGRIGSVVALATTPSASSSTSKTATQQSMNKDQGKSGVTSTPQQAGVTSDMLKNVTGGTTGTGSNSSGSSGIDIPANAADASSGAWI
jgi:hypothetical protein